MTENYVLSELVKATNDRLYYWNSGNAAEVDFVVQCDTDIIPIEVKSEENVRARSLAEYRRKYAPACAVITSMKSDTNGKEVLNIPLYMIASLNSFIDGHP